VGLQARPYLQRITALFGDDVDWDRHPYRVPAVRDLSALDFHPDVTFFIGENGAGKSTLLEAIALALGFSIDGGSRNVSNLNTAQEASPLFQSLRATAISSAPRVSIMSPRAWTNIMAAAPPAAIRCMRVHMARPSCRCC
jgi:predicted ATPase